MLNAIALKKYRLASDRTATLTVGTNATPQLTGYAVETTLHLYFGSTLGVSAAPLLNYLGQTEGIAIHLQGTESLEQLTDALEVGSRVLRWQTAGQTQALNVEQWGSPDERRLTIDEELAAIGWVPNWAEVDPIRREEQVIIEVIILFGTELLPDGTPVATYLINNLADSPLRTRSCADLWFVIRRLAAAGIVANGQHIWRATTAKQRAMLEELTPLDKLKNHLISPYWSTEGRSEYCLLVCQIITARLRQVTIQQQIEQTQVKLSAPDLSPEVKPELQVSLENLLAEAAQWGERRAHYLLAAQPHSEALSAAHCTPFEVTEDDAAEWSTELPVPTNSQLKEDDAAWGLIPEDTKGSGEQTGVNYE